MTTILENIIKTTTEHPIAMLNSMERVKLSDGKTYKIFGNGSVYNSKEELEKEMLKMNLVPKKELENDKIAPIATTAPVLPLRKRHKDSSSSSSSVPPTPQPIKAIVPTVATKEQVPIISLNALDYVTPEVKQEDIVIPETPQKPVAKLPPVVKRRTNNNSQPISGVEFATDKINKLRLERDQVFNLCTILYKKLKFINTYSCTGLDFIVEQLNKSLSFILCWQAVITNAAVSRRDIYMIPGIPINSYALYVKEFADDVQILINLLAANQKAIENRTIDEKEIQKIIVHAQQVQVAHDFLFPEDKVLGKRTRD